MKRQTSKQQSGQQQASPPQLTRPEPADSQPVVEQQEVVPNDEPWLEAIIPLPWGFSFPTVLGSPAALARLQFAPSSTAEGLGTPLPVASSPRADMPDAASPLAGKRRGFESVSDAESCGTAEALSADILAMVPLTPDDSHAPSLRRSSREDKKPRLYFAISQAEPPDKPPISKGLQRGFLKSLLSACFTLFSMTSRKLFGLLRLCFWYMSLVHMTLTCLACILNMLSLNVALLGVHFDPTFMVFLL